MNKEEYDITKKIMDKSIDLIYNYYETDHSLKMCAFLRPAQFECDVMPYPGDILDKKAFVDTHLNEGTSWRLAFDVLFQVLIKQENDQRDK